METTKIIGLPLLVFFYVILLVTLQGCNPVGDGDGCDGDDGGIEVYKPNVYIYPTENIDLSVKLIFPLGGGIVTSIPEYGTGWNVKVDTLGVINDTYSYLFYESRQPDVWQRDYGWSVKTDSLEPFFRQNMAGYGFDGREIDDFIDYWIPRLTDYCYYSIFPQTKGVIDNVIQLSFSKQPENILRLFYVVKGQDMLQDQLKVPTIDVFDREGYFVTEWGVVL